MGLSKPHIITIKQTSYMRSLFTLPAYHASCSKGNSPNIESTTPCSSYSYHRLTTPYAARVTSQILTVKISKHIIKAHSRLIVQSQAGLSKLRIDSNMNHKDQGNMALINFQPYINMVQTEIAKNIQSQYKPEKQGIQRLPSLNIKCYSRAAQPLS